MTSTIFFGIVFVVVIIGLVLWIASISRRAKAASDASDARLAENLRAAALSLPKTTPFAEETPAERSADVIKAATDPALSPLDTSPAGLKAERLAELSDLRAKGLITDDELAAARAKILAE